MSRLNLRASIGSEAFAVSDRRFPRAKAFVINRDSSELFVKVKSNYSIGQPLVARAIADLNKRTIVSLHTGEHRSSEGVAGYILCLT